MPQRAFLDDAFLLHSDAARELYFRYAATEPIFDYHCHLPPDQIAENKTFRNLFEIWLAGDHYKWRAMRSNGVEERFCTGDATDYEKYEAWVATVPATLRNPLYHWSHLELRRYFGIEERIGPDTARKIWDEANAQLPGMPVHEILRRNRVRVICTTDDPTDDLAAHRRILEEGRLETRVYPTYRPDKALAVDQPEAFVAWAERLEGVSGVGCGTFAGFLEALDRRHADFHAMGGRLSDHGLSHMFAGACSESEARAVYDRARSGGAVGREEADGFRGYMMGFFGELDAGRGWVKQLHLGAMRNNNARAFRAIGPDTGFDSIGDWPQAEALSRYMDRLESAGKLPKMVLYNLNPADNYVMGTMIGNFQGGGVWGKIQFGSGWWFLDQKEGMEWQINALSALGLLSRFVGMLTDSRSFLSYTRHEYFRRILCNLLGGDMERGELPDDMGMVGGMVRDICYGNAERWFGLGVSEQG